MDTKHNIQDSESISIDQQFAEEAMKLFESQPEKLKKIKTTIFG